MPRIDDQPCEPWFEDFTTRVFLAGKWREAGRTVPAAQAALERAADRQSAIAVALLQEMMDAHGPYGGKTVGARMP